MPEDIPEETNSPPPEPEIAENPEPQPSNHRKWFSFAAGLFYIKFHWLEPLIELWKDKQKEGWTVKGIIAFVFCICIVLLVAHKEFGDASSTSTQNQTITNPVKSPLQQVAAGGIGNQTIDYSTKTFSGSTFQNNRGIIIGSIANSSVQFITTNIFTPDPMKTAWDEDFKRDLVETLSSFQKAISTGDHEDAFEKSKEVIDTLESAPANFIQELPPSAKSGIYLMAYDCADGVGSNQLATEYAQKAFNFVQNDQTKLFLSMALHNLAIENATNATHNFTLALNLSRRAITYYESIKNPFLAAKLMDASAARFYHFGAQMALKNGTFNEAERYAFKATQIEPSENNQKLLISTLSFLGYAVIAAVGTNDFQIFLMKPPSPQTLCLNTNNEIITFDGNFKAFFHN